MKLLTISSWLAFRSCSYCALPSPTLLLECKRGLALEGERSTCDFFNFEFGLIPQGIEDANHEIN